MDKNDQLFMQLLYMFHTSAMQGLGKIADPTGHLNRNLEYVSQTIALMAMLKEKTKGNISEDIEKMLDGMLSDLRLNYVDEKSKTPEKVEEPEPVEEKAPVVEKTPEDAKSPEDGELKVVGKIDLGKLNLKMYYHT